MAAKADLDTTATSLEGQLLECAREIKQAEDAWIAAGLALDPPQTRARRMSLAINPTTGVATISATVPLTETDAADGVSYAADPYIV